MIDELSDSHLADFAFYKMVPDAFSTHIALLDKQGTILAVNARWQRFGEANGIHDARYGVGANYLTMCRAAVDSIAQAAAAGIRDVLSGHRSSFYLEYPCHSPDEKSWFALRATPFADYDGFVVVAHDNITERVIAERTSMQIEKLDLVVQRFPRWRDQIETLVAGHPEFLETCKDYQELAACVNDYQIWHGDRKVLEDSVKLLHSLADDIWRFLNAYAD
jgi:hypothetical protein